MAIVVQLNLCIGCGLCAEDCVRSILTVEDGKVKLLDGVCLGCGHCVAICPTDAIRLSGDTDADVYPYDAESFQIAPQRLLNFMKFRRSVRKFKSTPVEAAVIGQLLEAGRYAPTGANLQQVRYILIEKELNTFTNLALKTLYDTSQTMEGNPTQTALLRYQEKWSKFYPLWKDTGENKLFYNAAFVLVAVASHPETGTGRLDAGLASANIEFMANALGLGACYIGFFSMAADINPEILEKLGVQQGEEIVSVLSLGYPDVTYHRTVGRNPAEVTML